MLKEDQAQQLLDLNAITPEQYTKLTSVNPIDQLDFLPDTSPQQRLQWDAESQLAQERDAMIPQAMKDPGVVAAFGQPVAKPITRMDLIKKAKEISLNKQAAEKAAKQSDPA